MSLNPLIFNCWCSVCVPLLLPELRCTLSLLRCLLEDCSVAPVAATVLSLALAALWLLVPGCLRQLLLLRGRRWRCGWVVQNLLHDPQHLRRCHGVVRLPEQRAQLQRGTLVIYSHLHQTANTTRSRSVAPTCALPHVAATAVSLPPPRALAPDAAVTVLPLSHSAALFLLTHLLARALRGLCCICCPTFSYLTAPPVMQWRTSPPALDGHHAGRFSSSAALTRPASYEVDAARAPLLLPSSVPWLLYFTFRRCSYTHVNSSISHNVLPFIRCSARFRSPGARCICMCALPDFVTRNHKYFNMSVFPRPLLDAIAFATWEPVLSLTCEFSPSPHY